MTLEDGKSRSTAHREGSNGPSGPGVGCGRCDQRWGDVKTCHCGTCHHTLTTFTAFNKHRTLNRRTSDRECVAPQNTELNKTSRKYSCWGLPGDNR